MIDIVSILQRLKEIEHRLEMLEAQKVPKDTMNLHLRMGRLEDGEKHQNKRLGDLEAKAFKSTGKTPEKSCHHQYTGIDSHNEGSCVNCGEKGEKNLAAKLWDCYGSLNFWTPPIAPQEKLARIAEEHYRQKFEDFVVDSQNHMELRKALFGGIK